MNILDVRQLLYDALEASGHFEELSAIGHCVYVHVEGQEYEVVLRTVRSSSRLPLTKDTDGPVAQE